MLSRYPIAVFVDSDGKYNHCAPQHAMILPAGTQVTYVTCSALVHELLMDGWNATARASRLEMLAKNTGRTEAIPINPRNTSNTGIQNHFEDTSSDDLRQEFQQDGHVFVWFTSKGDAKYSLEFSQIQPGEIRQILRVSASVLARLYKALMSNDGQYEKYVRMLASGLGVSQGIIPPIPDGVAVDGTNWHAFVPNVQPIKKKKHGVRIPRGWKSLQQDTEADELPNESKLLTYTPTPLQTRNTPSGNTVSLLQGGKTDTFKSPIKLPSSKLLLRVVDENFIANNG